MHFLSFVFFSVLLALTTASLQRRGPLHIPLQKRSALLSSDGAFDMHIAQSHVAHVKRKYNMQELEPYQGNTDVPKPSRRGHGRRGVASVPLISDKNMRWYGNITVGTPPVEFMVVFDTGSSALILPGINSSAEGHTLYNPSASSTAVDLHQNFTVRYADSSQASGELYTDTISVAGLAAENQTFGAASQYPANFAANIFRPDGVFGLAFPELSMFKTNATPFLQTLIEEGKLPDPVFSIKLAPSGSELTIGSIDTSLCNGTITYTPVTEPMYWKIRSDSINVNDQAIFQNSSVIIDSGSTFIVGDEKSVGQFYSTLNATNIGGGFYTLPCNATPNVSITIGGKPFYISPELFNLGSYEPTGACIGAVVATGNFGDTWIFGDPFLQNVYTVFDIGKPQVGFCALA